MSEISIWHQFTHPNVIKMFGASHLCSPPLIVCEDAVNGNLANYLRKSTANKNRMWSLLYQAAMGLGYIHSKNVVHGDLKLNNILVGADGQAKLADFGLSSVRISTALTKTNSDSTKQAGALRWRAPECLTGRPTFASDVYSFAMCIVEAATGEPPFSFASDDDVRDNLRRGVIPAKPGDMTEGAWALIVSMTNINQSNRISLAKAVAGIKVFADVETPEAPCANCSSFVMPGAKFCPTCGYSLDGKSQEHGEIEAYDKETTRPPALVQRNTDRFRIKSLLQSSLDLTSTELSLLDIPELLTLLCADEELKDKILLLLMKLTLETEDYCHALFCANGIPVLVGLVRNGSETQKQSAVELLKTLARNAEINLGIGMCDGIQQLLELIHQGTPAQKIVAIDTLRELSTNGPNRMIIEYADGIQPLLELILKDISESVRVGAAFVIANICYSKDRAAAVASEGGIPIMADLIRNGTDTLKLLAIISLMGITRHASGGYETIVEEGGISLLVGLLECDNNFLRVHAAEFLYSLSKFDAHKASIVTEGAITSLIRTLKKETSREVEISISLLESLVDSTCSHNILVAEGGIAVLATALEIGNDFVKQCSVSALSKLCVNNDNVLALYHLDQFLYLRGIWLATILIYLSTPTKR